MTFRDTRFTVTLLSEDIKSYYTTRLLELQNISVGPSSVPLLHAPIFIFFYPFAASIGNAAGSPNMAEMSRLVLSPTDGRETGDLPLSLHRLARLWRPRVPGVFPQLPLQSAGVGGAGGGPRSRRGALQRGNWTLGDVLVGGHLRGLGKPHPPRLH